MGNRKSRKGAKPTNSTAQTSDSGQHLSGQGAGQQKHRKDPSKTTSTAQASTSRQHLSGKDVGLAEITSALRDTNLAATAPATAESHTRRLGHSASGNEVQHELSTDGKACLTSVLLSSVPNGHPSWRDRLAKVQQEARSAPQRVAELKKLIYALDDSLGHPRYAQVPGRQELRDCLAPVINDEERPSPSLCTLLREWDFEDDSETDRPPTSGPRPVKDEKELIETLRASFYDVGFTGPGHAILFQDLQTYEDEVVKSWSEAGSLEPRPNASSDTSTDGQTSLTQDPQSLKAGHTAPPPGPLPVYARCLPIVQSSGMGKSRLMRELGRVVDHQGVPQIDVFLLCLRPEYPGSDACWPKPDEDVRRFLNQATHETGSHWVTWELRAQTFFWQLYMAGAKVLKEEGRVAWVNLCDPDTPFKRRNRNVFMRQVVDESRQQLKRLVKASKLPGGTSLRDSLGSSYARVQEAARALHQALQGRWFAIAIDEAGSLVPAGLEHHLSEASESEKAASITAADHGGKEEELGKIRVSRLCLGALARLFAQPAEGTSGAKSEPPPRFWLLLSDTASSITTLVPPRAEHPSMRYENMATRRVPPFCPLNLDADQLRNELWPRFLEITPRQACKDDMLALTGRPLWRSYLQAAPATAASSPSASPPRKDTPRPHHGAVPAGATPDHPQGSVRGSATFHANPELVLQKLLGPVAPWELGVDQCLALLSQRIDIVTRPSKDLARPQSINVRALNSRKVQHHLGVVMSLPMDGEHVEVLTAHEPVVVQSVVGLFRTCGNGLKGQEAFANILSGGTWPCVWPRFKTFLDVGLPVDVGERGELEAQMLICAAHDAARRRHEDTDIPFRQRAFRGDSAFVHLDDLLAELMAGGLPDTMAIPKDAWTSFQCFRRAPKYDFTREDLVEAFFLHKGIVGAKNQSSYDLVFPVYCGSLNEVFDPDRLTWAEVQVKSRVVKHKATMLPQKPKVGDFPPGVDAGAEFVPASPPILIWLEMSGPTTSLSREPAPILVEVRKAPAEPEQKAAETPDEDVGDSPPDEAEDGDEDDAGQEYWWIEFPLFDQRNHPCMKDWPPGVLRPVSTILDMDHGAEYYNWRRDQIAPARISPAGLWPAIGAKAKPRKKTE